MECKDIKIATNPRIALFYLTGDIIIKKEYKKYFKYRLKEDILNEYIDAPFNRTAQIEDMDEIIFILNLVSQFVLNNDSDYSDKFKEWLNNCIDIRLVLREYNLNKLLDGI